MNKKTIRKLLPRIALVLVVVAILASSMTSCASNTIVQNTDRTPEQLLLGRFCRRHSFCRFRGFTVLRLGLLPRHLFRWLFTVVISHTFPFTLQRCLQACQEQQSPLRCSCLPLKLLHCHWKVLLFPGLLCLNYQKHLTFLLPYR